jgi:hypothetical protein
MPPCRAPRAGVCDALCARTLTGTRPWAGWQGPALARQMCVLEGTAGERRFNSPRSGTRRSYLTPLGEPMEDCSIWLLIADDRPTPEDSRCGGLEYEQSIHAARGTSRVPRLDLAPGAGFEHTGMHAPEHATGSPRLLAGHLVDPSGLLVHGVGSWRPGSGSKRSRPRQGWPSSRCPVSATTLAGSGGAAPSSCSAGACGAASRPPDASRTRAGSPRSPRRTCGGRRWSSPQHRVEPVQQDPKRLVTHALGQRPHGRRDASSPVLLTAAERPG